MNIECSVCLEQVMSEDTLVTLECNHSFHKCCIYRLEIGSCPLCREPICKEGLCEGNHDITNYFSISNYKLSKNTL